MSRFLTWLILALLAIGIFFIYRYVQDSYKTAIPADTTRQPEEETALVQTESHYEDWHEFTAPSKDFKVLFPILPQHAADKINDPLTQEKRKYDMYVAVKNDGTVFMISAIKFPDEIKDETSETLLTKVVNDMLARNKDNKLKMMQSGNLRNFKTLDFSIENADILMGGKAFVYGDTLYVLSMVSKNGRFNTKDFDFFVNSFDLVPASEKPKVQPVEQPTPKQEEPELDLQPGKQ